MTLELSALVLPAFDDLPDVPSEAAPWHDRYALDNTLEIEGLSVPIRYSENGLGVVPTGIGKAAAATTTTALLSDDRLDLSGALVCSVGVAGGPPDLTIGSVVLATAIVDWDDKCRFEPESDEPVPLATNPYTDGQGVFHLDRERLDQALDVGERIDLESVDGGLDTRENGRSTPQVVTGTNVCGDELWHGDELAEQVEWLVETAGVDPYRVTEMEDAGTAFALSRFGRLDQYLSVRGVSNHDRPVTDVSARESFFSPTFEDGFETGLTNAVRVASALVDERLR